MGRGGAQSRTSARPTSGLAQGGRNPKSGRGREVPLNETARAALTRWRHLRGPFVFSTDGGRMLTRHEAETVLRRAQRRAQLGGFSWHALRHTFASHLVMRGVPLKSVQELLGHASIEMAMRYAHLSPAINRDAVRALDAQVVTQVVTASAQPRESAARSP